jgi:hypothetical protein
MWHLTAGCIIPCGQSMFAHVQAFDTHEFPMPTSMLQRLCSYA